MPGSGPGGRWFKSIRPDHFLLEPIIYRHIDRSGVGQEVFSSNRIAPLRLRFFPFSHRLTLRCVMFSNWWKLSNLSNTCPHDEPGRTARHVIQSLTSDHPTL